MITVGRTTRPVKPRPFKTKSPPESVGRRKAANFATRQRLVIPSLTFRLTLRLAFRLTLLPGHSKKSGCFLLHVLAAALGAFRVFFVFLQGKNQFEGLVTIVADVVVHGHGGLPLDCEHELRLELYADMRRLSGSPRSETRPYTCPPKMFENGFGLGFGYYGR